MLFLRRFIAVGGVFLLASCAGGGTSGRVVPVGNASGISRTSSAVVPFEPTSSADTLRSVARPNVAAAYPSLGLSEHVRSSGGLSALSTIVKGDAGFEVGDATAPASTATFAVMTAYATSQYALPYPPSGKTTAPAKPVERFFGPEISPGTSCLAMGVLYANFGPGGTQRNGPGDPVETQVGPYNALRVLDFCNVPPNQPATFYLTPLDDRFLATYVRSNEHGLPSLVGEIASPDPAGSTNARWYALLYNFEEERWDVVLKTRGTNPVNAPGEAVAYSGSRNLPQVCPNLPAIVARKISIYDASERRFRKADASNSIRIFPGVGIDPLAGITTSAACFTADATGPANLAFSFLNPNNNAAWELTGTSAFPTDDSEPEGGE